MTNPAKTIGRYDLDELLRQRRQIAHIWSIEDVQSVRTDLSDEQAWLVLQAVDRCKDAEHGIHWETIRVSAEHLFPEA
ncbi:hypothetical protein [Botrimarina hoheduenensis]|uniref:Uncharacterized protein n=1 Tax=Botrimarina hoheduenensis TaxID=2528000 RepID=A0A5C5VTC9_9BACT|nr:hypothetical protein [Botrimarina hoheduenensis]TWT41363.1 hypothetical protein Pla111_30770 [Botrimarina hoheduenensis]